MITRKRILCATLASILGLLMIIGYNWSRIFGLVHWGFSGKAYAINLIPFNNMDRYISFLLNTRTLAKLLFFVAMGIIFMFVLEQLLSQKTMIYATVCAVFILFMELLVAFTSEMTVHIDANNIILYVVGLFIGFWVWKIGFRLYKLVKSRSKKLQVADANPSH